jgi:hypothetical protein
MNNDNCRYASASSNIVLQIDQIGFYYIILQIYIYKMFYPGVPELFFQLCGLQLQLQL